MAVQDEPEAPDVATARERLDREATAVGAEQLEQALSRLRETGDLTDEQRAAVEALSERIVDGLLAAPRAGLRDSADRAEAARTVLELFD
jgi:glutamyl-tRNA reductase